MRYLPHTDSEIEDMLTRIGVSSIDDLFEPIPEEHRAGPFDLEPALDEHRLMGHLTKLAAQNRATGALSFLGAGMYDHHIPPAMDQLLLRSEFYTAYTPYQAEMAQGTLQAMFEFQTLVCELLGQEVANASMYCAASASAEAALMARRVTRKSTIVVADTVHPHYRETIQTYLAAVDGGQADMEVVGHMPDGRINLEELAQVSGDAAAVIVGYPNFFGCVEDLDAIKTAMGKTKALLVTATSEPYALALLAAPGGLGADICVAEGQSLAVPPQFGGPGVGLFSCRKKYVRKMPGRLIGQTVDSKGERGFVLTLSTREQHIRREKATSNICTNHSLIALAFTIRTAMLGQQGFERAADLCLRGTEYLKAQIATLSGYALPYDAPTFNEFVVRADTAVAPMLKQLADDGILAGVDLSRLGGNPHEVLIAVTEKHDKTDLDRLVTALRNASQS